MRKNVWMAMMLLQTMLAGLNAQTLTLDECRQAARQNYPAIKQYDLVEKSRDLTLSNAQKVWLPGVSVNVFGGAFTDIMDLGGPVSAMTGDMKNYLAGGSVMISQTIYDGGSSSASKQITKAWSDVEARQVDVTLYGINERVEQLYFGVLMLDEQLHQLSLLQNDLGLSEKTVRSLIKGGLANQSDLDAVSVQQVQTQQQEIGLKAQRATYLNMLGYFIGRELDGNTQLAKPEASSWEGLEGTARPELSYYSSQETLLGAQRKSLDARLLPTVGAFGMGAVHNKVLSTLKAGTLAAGVTLKWNIGALYTRKNDLASLANRQQQIDVQRRTFLFNNQLQSRQSSGTISNIRKQMELDDKAVALRQSIREKAEKKVKNGTETVNELLRDVNAVSEARQQKAIHEIQLLQEEYRLKNITNHQQ